MSNEKSVVEAIQYNGKNYTAIQEFTNDMCVESPIGENGILIVQELNSPGFVYPGDWILKTAGDHNFKICKLRHPDNSFSKKLADITDDHIIEACKLLGGIDHISREGQIHQFKELFLTNQFYNKETNIAPCNWYKVFRFFEENGYKIPAWSYAS